MGLLDTLKRCSTGSSIVCHAQLYFYTDDLEGGSLAWANWVAGHGVGGLGPWHTLP